MPKTAAFVLPRGLSIDLSGGTLDITHEGDLVIENDLGLPLGTIRAGGDLTIKLDKATGDLEAKGEVAIHGEVDATRLHGKSVVLGRKRVTCTTISADQTITIGAAELKVDAIVAPEIRLDAKASGRVTVIESLNDRGATKIKGGFSAADYDDMFGDAEAFLSERGVKALDTSSSEAAAPEADPVVEEEEEEDDVTIDTAMVDEEPPVKAVASAVEDAPVPLTVDDIEPLAEDAIQSDDELHPKLVEGLERIIESYDAGDLPPAVDELRDLITEKDYPALRQNITEIWNGLLGFHQKRGIRPHPQVTHAFNLLHSLLK